MTRECVFSLDRLYRYQLWRDWDIFETGTYLMVIGLNPSTADEHVDDPTVRKCIGFAKRWGYGALVMTNIFAWRDTQPADMKRAAEPVGELNDTTLRTLSGGASMVLAAWGNHGAYHGRAAEVLGMIPNLHYLRLNANGSPMHPLYVPYGETPKPF